MPHAKIHSKQATFTLDKLHSELAGRILDNQAEAKRLRAAMVHVEAVLKLLDPAYSLRRIAVRRRKPNVWFKRGTVLRYALDTLRTATEPLTAREVSMLMLKAKGADPADLKSLRTLTGAVKSSFKHYKGRGIVTAGEGRPARWRVSP